MNVIKSVLRLNNVNREDVQNFIKIWSLNDDFFPCKDIKISEIKKGEVLIEIFYSQDIFDKSITQFIAILFAEIPFIKHFGDVTFVDLELPTEVYDWFGGPKFGVEEIIKRFGVKNYPLLMAIIKPSLKTNLIQRKEKIKAVISGGFHSIKDDEMLGDVSDLKLKNRIELAKEYGKYIPVLNLDTVEDYKKYLGSGESKKIGMVLINASNMGFPLVKSVRDTSNVPLCSHMAMQGTFAKNFSAKMFAKLHRLFGCDSFIVPIGGTDYYNLSKEEEKEMMDEFTKELPIKKTLPILVGGASPKNIVEIVEPYKKIGIPFGVAFGTFIFTAGTDPYENCKFIVEKLEN